MEKPKYVVLLNDVPYFKRRGWPAQKLPDLDDPLFAAAYEKAMSEWQNCTGIGQRSESGKPKLKAADWAIFLKSRLVSAEKRAKRQGVPFSISQQWIAEQLKRQGNRCALTGMRFRVDRPKHAPFAPSIDRIKPQDGYTSENCRIICYIANCARNQFTDDELILMAAGIVTVAEKSESAA